jgi:hypothetical protein
MLGFHGTIHGAKAAKLSQQRRINLVNPDAIFLLRAEGESCPK